MEGLETLLRKRWILKSEEKELYYKVRDELGEIRQFASEKMGCQIVENALLVKMEKIPPVAETFMGIQDFSSREEYAFLCILLMFLEDKDAQDQFILSQLTEYIASNMPGGSVDWTLYTSRRRLIRVLRYAVDQGILRITDGREDSFAENAQGEVLYENTGASRYFMRSFSKDIMQYTKPEDFQESDWFDMDEERGIARRHRVYKRLLFSLGIYLEKGAQEDFEYLKYYGRRLSDDLERMFDCYVHIHRGSAYLLVGGECRIGKEFPGNNVLSDIMLLCFSVIRERISEGKWKVHADEICTVDQPDFERMLKEVKQRFGSGFTKNYREMPEGEFVRIVSEAMETWMFIERKPSREIMIYPAAGKIQGHYPKDYMGGQTDEQQMAGK